MNRNRQRGATGGGLKTVQQAAELLALSPHTIRAWIASRDLEHVRLGRAVRVRMEEIQRLIERGTVPARANRDPASALVDG